MTLRCIMEEIADHFEPLRSLPSGRRGRRGAGGSLQVVQFIVRPSRLPARSLEQRLLEVVCGEYGQYGI